MYLKIITLSLRTTANRLTSSAHESDCS